MPKEVQIVPEEIQIIKEILAQRKIDAEIINTRISFFENLLAQIEKFDILKSSITDKDGKLKEESVFASTLAGKPDMVASIASVDSSAVKSKINEQLRTLRTLKVRFERESIAIQVFGLAGSGKSTLIKNITNLSDEVIPTCGVGLHCTGASSFIYNSDKFEARAYCYTKEQILNIFNKILKQVLSDNGRPEATISSFSDIESFNPAEFGLDNNDLEVKGLLRYKDHYSLICDDIKTAQENGGFIQIHKPSDVKLYVAQHNGDGSIKYFHYLAVEKVEIYTKFNYENAGNIVLMDNVGLGDVTNDTSTEMNMYKAIAESSDAVIHLYSPQPQGGWRGDEGMILSRLNELLYIDKSKTEQRLDPKALFLCLNKRETPTWNNSADCTEMAEKFKDPAKFNRSETVLIVDASSQNDTITSVLIPVLNQLRKNLGQIDAGLMKSEEKNGAVVYDEYCDFLNQISAVLLSGSSADELDMFDGLFRDLFDQDMKNAALNALDKTKDQRNAPIKELRNRLQSLSNDDAVRSYVEDLTPSIQDAVLHNEQFFDIYRRASLTLRHNVPNKFRSIDLQLANYVEQNKEEILGMFISEGRLDRIISKQDGQSMVSWCRKILKTFITEDTYPHLNKSINSFLSFKIDVDGFLIFRIIKHLDVFEEIAVRNISKNEMVNAVKYHLNQRLQQAMGNIRPELDNFLSDPNEAVLFNLEEFYVAVFEYPECISELRSLYRRYRQIIWREEYEVNRKESAAFKEWADIRDTLRTYDNRGCFTSLPEQL